ncbi:helix-turn-helix transcriptional regulator [Flavobacterium oreochromis]|uniref:helix-turn-helix domain-containing protein n=1 Tax=Flavobacterium oreochromis TaxID=2906078 RepID=UPI00385F6B42
METLAGVLKTTRESKGLLLREVASLIDVDTAMISRFEKGDRNPTRPQLEKLSVALDLNFEELLTLWLSEKIYDDIQGEVVALKALHVAEERIKYNSK